MKVSFLAAILGLSITLSSCELAETTLPPGDEVLAVEAILRVGAPRQRIILHRSLDGRVIVGEPDAEIVVTDELGHSLEFVETELDDCLTSSPDTWEVEDLTVNATCYLSPPQSAMPFVRRGSTYELSIRTAGGATIRGRTTVPGSYRFETPNLPLSSQSSTVTCTLPDTTFNMVWRQSNGSWSYLVGLRLEHWGEDLRAQGIDVPDPLELTGVSVSATDTTLAFPSNIGLFQRGDLDQRLLIALQKGIPRDADATLVILAGDRNYTNAIRGGRFSPSGNVRGSSVVGGAVGVFGSLVPISIDSHGTPTNSPPCPMS